MTGEHDLDAPLQDAFEGLASEVRSTSVTSGRVLSASRNRTQGKRAVLGTLAVAVVAAVVVQASLSGGNEAGPSNPNPSPTGRVALGEVPDGSPLRGVLENALPQRLGPWEQGLPKTFDGGAVACVGDDLASSLPDVAASWTDAYLVSEPDGGRKAFARSLSWLANDGSMTPVVTALRSAVARCGPDTHSVSPDGRQVVRWIGKDFSSTVLMVTRGNFVGAVTIDVADSAGGLTPAEETAVLNRVFDSLEWQNRPGPGPGTPAPDAGAGDALQAALLDGVPVDGDPSQAGMLLDDGYPPCQPRMVGGDESEPRPQTLGDVLADAVKIAATSDRHVVVEQGAVLMRTTGGAAALEQQWHRFIADCAPRRSDHASATVISARSVPGGYAVDLLVRPNANSGPSAFPTPGGTAPRRRTIYLGRTGRVVTFLDVERAAEHPEVRDELLPAALARLAPEGR